MKLAGPALAPIIVVASAGVLGALVGSASPLWLEHQRDQRERRRWREEQQLEALVEVMGILDDEYRALQLVYNAYGRTPADILEQLVKYRSALVRHAARARMMSGPHVQEALDDIANFQRGFRDFVTSAPREDDARWGQIETEMTARFEGIYNAYRKDTISD